jgi:hypothetical protein
LGFFSKKNKKAERDDSQESQPAPKKVSDSSIKPKAPKSLAGKRAIRTVFWVFMGLLLLKGAISFAQGTRVIQQQTIIGNTESSISDSVKGFAADFATEYFTWEADFVADRNKRLGKFIKGINADMGVTSLDVKGSSRVTSSEVYSTNKIDDQHIDVTIVVWREVQPLPDQLKAAQGTATTPPVIMKKTYMIVPVTLAQEGPVIESYPRFVSEQQKGDTVNAATTGTRVSDENLVKLASDLADSYLRSWYEGNASQMKYFYADSVKSPDNIQKSEFIYQKLEKVSLFSIPATNGQSKSYRIAADISVKSDIDEPFANSWSLIVTEKAGRLYVVSNGIPQPDIKSPTPAATENTASANPDSTASNSPAPSSEQSTSPSPSTSASP